MSAGPLQGRLVVELGGLGPLPFAGMLLAGLGADVIRVEQPGADLTGGAIPPRYDLLNRGKRSIVLDLKSAEGMAGIRALAVKADAMLEGYRPGVVERLGVGPEDLMAHNPKLVYGRMTGWGQQGPLARVAGHDLNFIAITGALHAIGEKDHAPQVPLNLIGDMGGGGTFLVMGVLAAIMSADRTGRGQVVDAAIVDGTLNLLAIMHSLMAAGNWNDARGTNVLSGEAPYYGLYRTADDGFMAVACVERKFYAEMLRLLGLGDDPARQLDRERWPDLRARVAAIFASRPRDHWAEVFERAEACVTPVLSLLESAQHPQIKDRRALVRVDGVLQTMPAPRMDSFDDFVWTPAPLPGQHTAEILAELGLASPPSGDRQDLARGPAEPAVGP